MIKHPVIQSMNRQRGFLLIVAVLLILLAGTFSLTMIALFAGSATSTVNFIMSDQSYYIAEAGFEETARLLLTPVLTGTNSRISCAAITGTSLLTNTAVGAGTFTATTVSGSPAYVNTTLSSAINNSVTIIPVASTAGFAAEGRIMVDNEVMNYGAISGNSFIGVQRGANYNYNTPHATGTPVAQYQCDINVDGGVPNLIAPLSKRTIQQSLQMQEAWVAGVVSSTNYVFTRWNRPTQNTWTSSLVSNASATTLNGISMLSNADGWAVGNVVGTSFTLLHWTGSAWSLAASPAACSSQHMVSVSAVYKNEVWAVGPTTRVGGSCSNAGGTRRYSILYWNGTTWTILTSATTPSIPVDASTNQNLNAVHVIDATQSGSGTLGFAVGAAGKILQYNGSTWVSVTSPTANNLTDVFVVSSTEAWAVGAAGTIIKWNGTTWATVTSPTATQLNSIAMLNYSLGSTATTGWAVGNAGVAVSYNGSTWSLSNTGSAVNLLGVGLYNTSPGQDVWAVGASGTILHYNGTAWASVASGVAQQLNGISLIAPQQFPYAESEIFP